ncbi:unnamed protein product [Lymnaea stagnalis]|uniref:Amino acid transporter n=1 Tax=Lymnaea stagnalis TaxID=6523 RepID=A0AAV2H0Z9_LYMST
MNSLLHESDVRKQETRHRRPVNREQLRRGCALCLKNNGFLLLNCVGIFLGFLIGLTVKSTNPSADTLMWIGLPGELYMRVLKVVILPLIVCTVISGTASTDATSSGRIGVVAISYIILTNAVCGVFGLVLCLLVKPGSVAGQTDQVAVLDTKNLQTVDILTDFIRNIFPDNIVGAALQLTQTKYTEQLSTELYNVSGTPVNITGKSLSKSLGTVPGTNILGLIVVSAAIGIAASKAGDKVRRFTEFFQAGAVIIFNLFNWLKWSTPVGVVSLIARAVSGMDDVSTAFTSMAMFVLVAAGGNLMCQLLVHGPLYFIFTRKSPIRFLMIVAKPWMMAFGAASSAIPLPELMTISAEEYQIDPRVSGFVLPFSITLNRDGSCLFVSATCLFLAQYSGIPLSTGIVLTIGLLSILSSLAIPNVPSSSVVSVLIILGSVGIPATSIGLVMAVEWINDRMRTTTNLVSHLLAVIVTWRLCRNSFKSTNEKSLHLNDVAEMEIFVK